MERANDRSDNPYTFMEGYKVIDAAGEEVGEVEETVYDAPSDVLKYIVVDGRPVPAESVDVNVGEQRVSLPYDRETVESAPEMEVPSGAFDEAVRKHYEGRA